MNKDEIAQLSEDLGEIAADILSQLVQYKIKPTIVEKFYLGLLRRERLILRDAAFVLKNNHEQQLTSAFILLRVLLDDFIWVFYVYSSEEMEEDILKIQADAIKHRIKNMEESLRINNDFYNGQSPLLFTQTEIDAQKHKIINDPEYDNCFIDKIDFKLKSSPQIAKIFEIRKKTGKTKANVHSYVLYKNLSQYIHYSNLSYHLDNNPLSREPEITQIEEVLHYCYKMLLMQFDFLGKTYHLNWNDPEKIGEYFKEKLAKYNQSKNS